MRHALLPLSFALLVFLSASTKADDSPTDLTSASVVTPDSLSVRENKAVQMFLDEIESRTQIRLPLLHSLPADSTPTILIGTAPALKPFADSQKLELPQQGPAEGYHLVSHQNSLYVIGNDPRGVLFGVGRLLRTLRLSRQQITLRLPPVRTPQSALRNSDSAPPPFGNQHSAFSINISSAPSMKIRGHQLGYRPKTNSYDGWSVPLWEQYIRDLAVFGTNTIELIPPRSDDAADSPLFPIPQMRMMTEMSRLADAYGLDVSIWYPAMDRDYTNPKTIEFALKEWADVFSKLPRVDALFVPGGDPGHTRPTVLFSLLEKQAANLHRFHPSAQIWLSPQSFDQPQLEEFFHELDKSPAWLTGIVYGPQIRIPLPECRKRTPARYPIRNYPDITHTHHCQYPVPDWDLAFAVTEAREPICPRPTQMANIFRLTRPDTIGFCTYSEGCNDDANKIVFSALGWDPDTDLTDILREYARYFISPQFENDFAQGLLALEHNWSGPVATNDSIPATLALFQKMERTAPPTVKLKWRFQQALYRAYYDAYIHARLPYETRLEEDGLKALDTAPQKGAGPAIKEAQDILNQAVTHPIAQDLRARVFELAEALFQSIRMQLSVQRYGAIAVHRGANLDRIDKPLNNRLFLMSQFEEIAKLDSEPARLSRLHDLVHWQDPGPGGFYDDLGNLTKQPHLVQNPDPPNDPDFYHTPNVRIEDRSEGGNALPITWWSTVGPLFDQPLRMRYDHLDPQAHYTLKLVYPPSGNASPVRLLANDKFEIHPYLRKESQILEFPLPQQATSTGSLTLTWLPTPGRGHSGRNFQLAEVWLFRN